MLAFTRNPTADATPLPADPFAPLRQETLRAIAQSGVVRQFPKQTVLIHDGDAGDSLHILLAGRVKIYASNAAGRESRDRFPRARRMHRRNVARRLAAVGVRDDGRA